MQPREERSCQWGSGSAPAGVLLEQLVNKLVPRLRVHQLRVGSRLPEVHAPPTTPHAVHPAKILRVKGEPRKLGKEASVSLGYHIWPERAFTHRGDRVSGPSPIVHSQFLSPSPVHEEFERAGRQGSLKCAASGKLSEEEDHKRQSYWSMVALRSPNHPQWSWSLALQMNRLVLHTGHADSQGPDPRSGQSWGQDPWKTMTR